MFDMGFLGSSAPSSEAIDRIKGLASGLTDIHRLPQSLGAFCILIVCVRLICIDAMTAASCTC